MDIDKIVSDAGGDQQAEPQQSTPDTQASSRDYGRDIDGLRSELGGVVGEMRSFLAEYRKSSGASQPAAAKVEDAEPKRPKGADATEENIEKWIDDRAKWISRREYAELHKASSEQRQKDESQANQRKSLQEHFSRAAEARKDYADFDNVISSPTVQVSDKIAEEILTSPISAHLQYTIWKNPTDRFNVISAFQQSERAGIKALDRIEARIESELAAKKAAKKKTNFGITESFDSEVSGKTDESELSGIVDNYYKPKSKRK